MTACRGSRNRGNEESGSGEEPAAGSKVDLVMGPVEELVPGQLWREAVAINPYFKITALSVEHHRGQRENELLWAKMDKVLGEGWEAVVLEYWPEELKAMGAGEDLGVKLFTNDEEILPWAEKMEASCAEAKVPRVWLLDPAYSRVFAEVRQWTMLHATLADSANAQENRFRHQVIASHLMALASAYEAAGGEMAEVLLIYPPKHWQGIKEQLAGGGEIEARFAAMKLAHDEVENREIMEQLLARRTYEWGEDQFVRGK